MYEYKSKLQCAQMDYLCKAILSLKDQEECYRFFEDIFTINELKSIEQRLQVAKMLKQKKTYTEIAKETGASTATISRVNRCLNYGSDGYNVVLERIKWE
ncbi:YerC/YecD family TrpR-related protein [Clostridium botulinum]|uniref:TrpR-like protein YerC/YecD n=1 Tax=Clostridium botulinum TaxID=1491 RepID=A0A9Q1V1I5_CLOBO|nr:YerC/YecD family TrpR-related protein [Clostridium botulinum]KEI02379.1 TrpR-like protein YerC/YecD [Clostridium botulinum C/D str. Sp77]KEI02565.1 TrpR-like protein YerC/YecD [Clostridium botulinum D str. 16868]KLU76664.1 TrpR-like protein YerC/YecD [Clostridium botulinum V891]KOA74125.1 TrpR-like protein YerC/YecD [Clostridium botulinum]KOA83307.1 TrpR-like protein YerC/YecD [Clostridium botulinum]